MRRPVILLVEDNALTRRLVKAALAHEPCTLLEAPDATSALRLLDHEERPDLVLQDLVLPDMGGFDLVQRLRAHPATANVPILAFTGLLSKSDEAKFTISGFDGLITKPVEPSRLLYIVRGHLPALEATRGPFGKGKRLLLVDDDPIQLKLGRFRLSKLGFEVDTAPDGQTALDVAASKRPDVVVTDALMPRLDGFGLCLALRRSHELSRVPVILVTASYLEPGDRDLAARAGANAFVVRTADLGGVVNALQSVFQEARTELAPEQPELTQEVEGVRTARALRQLERQVSLNSGLVQRCSTLAAELSVLSSVADALVHTRAIERALAEILANCLDVAGTSRGAIFLLAPDGTFSLSVEHGFGRESVELEALLANPATLRRASEKAMITLDAISETAVVTPPARGAVLVSLTAHGERLGVMLLDAPGSGEPSEDWSAFARAIGGQVSLAIALSRAFSRLESSEQRVRTLMENAADAIFVASDDGRIVDVNHSGEQMLGLVAREILGRSFLDFIADMEVTEAGDEEATIPQARAASARVRRSDGRIVPVELSAAPVAVGHERVFVSIVRDVSERNALAEQLRQAQKMEAIGRLAGGIAHDFNNLLSIVLSYSDLLMEAFSADDPRAADVAEIKTAGDRAADLTRQLLAFSRQQILEPRVLQPNEVIGSMTKMLKRLLGADIDLSVALDPDLGSVSADLGQLHQIILNLVVNARDAMPEGGKLRIDTRNVDVGSARATPSMKTGSYVTISVADSGMGMDESTRSRIFEPFFTTKSADRGTGLGLSTVFGIVRQSGGAIRVTSEVGKGSTFDVYLPRVSDSPTTPSSRAAEVATLHGSETVLVVDDDPAILTLCVTLLRRYGYRVIDANGAGEALLAAEQHDGPIDLLMTDLVLPRLSGPQLAARLASARPRLKTLFMSGHTDDRDVPAMPAEIDLLPKPILPDSLARKVRAVLDDR